METMSDLVPSATMESSQRVLRALLRLLAPAIDAHHLVLAEMQQKAVDVSWVRFGAFVRSTSLIQCRCVWHQTDSCAHFLSPFFFDLVRPCQNLSKQIPLWRTVYRYETALVRAKGAMRIEAVAQDSLTTPRAPQRHCQRLSVQEPKIESRPRRRRPCLTISERPASRRANLALPARVRRQTTTDRSIIHRIIQSFSTLPT